MIGKRYIWLTRTKKQSTVQALLKESLIRRSESPVCLYGVKSSEDWGLSNPLNSERSSRDCGSKALGPTNKSPNVAAWTPEQWNRIMWQSLTGDHGRLTRVLISVFPLKTSSRTMSYSQSMLPIIYDHDRDCDRDGTSVTSCSKRRKFGAEGPTNPVQTGRGRIRGRRGHLKLMTEIPFDILHEIFGHLDPIDLLHLSWSTRALNSIVMSRSGRILWINVHWLNF